MIPKNNYPMFSPQINTMNIIYFKVLSIINDNKETKYTSYTSIL